MAEFVYEIGDQLVSATGTVWKCEERGPLPEDGGDAIYRFRSAAGAYQTGKPELFASMTPVVDPSAPPKVELAEEGEPGIRVTIEDLATADLSSRIIWNDYMVVAAGNRSVHSIHTYKNGTAVITIKVDR